MLITVFIKSNVFSIIYSILIFRIIFSTNKLKIMTHSIKYVSVCLICQYFIYILNITSLTVPDKFPILFRYYPFRDNPYDE